MSDDELIPILLGRVFRFSGCLQVFFSFFEKGQHVQVKLFFLTVVLLPMKLLLTPLWCYVRMLKRVHALS